MLRICQRSLSTRWTPRSKQLNTPQAWIAGFNSFRSTGDVLLWQPTPRFLSLDTHHPSEAHEEEASASVFFAAQIQNESKQRPLPFSCPGCGALTQTVSPHEAGFYTRSRNAVKNYLKTLRQNETIDTKNEDEANLYDNVESEVDIEISGEGQQEGDAQEEVSAIPITREAPICDRCHELTFNSRGVSIAHPSIDAIADSIAESPFRRNHVYHVIDAVDFPMSLIPSIHRSLSLAKPRSKNRRSQHDFSSKPALSFLITRSDLLSPNKDTVDSLMPYFANVLRKTLGRFGQDMRLGNVHLVSSKRGWWTTDIKESIWKRGGGNWMVGKVNVGKSNLFEVLFPKASGERGPSHTNLEREANSALSLDEIQSQKAQLLQPLPEDSLLPPAQPETAFPVLPLVSSLPGTTASPIRLPFGGHRGELIDLPGFARGNLEDFVQPDDRSKLVMRHRPTVKQHVIKPSQSLLLGGGLIRITPLLDDNDQSTTMLAYPYVPIDAHVTSTEKAIGQQLQERESGIKAILADGAGKRMRLAGTLKLDTDVTNVRARSLLNASVPLERLPFKIYATDVLIEGVGWVELVCQVRRQRQPVSTPAQLFPQSLIQSAESQSKPENDAATSPGIATFTPLQPTNNVSALEAPSVPTSQEFTPTSSFQPFPYPLVEIHTPNGSYIAKRPCMSLWTLVEGARKRKTTARPRKSMKGAKKREKAARRAKEATEGE